ncbi:MAG: sigma-70 family RNA polymerase sigma factor [Planctomycetales bacterium]
MCARIWRSKFAFFASFLSASPFASHLQTMSASDLVIDASSDSGRRGWSAVIELARQGCRESFDTLTKACWGYLIFAARDRLPRDMRVKIAPSDLVQQSLIVAYSNFSQFTGSSENDLLRWLETIVHNQALAAGRFYRNTQARNINLEVPFEDARVHDCHDSQTPSRLLIDRQQKELLLGAIEKLPDHYRTVLQLRGFDGLTFEAIGTVMGRSEEATRKLWITALRHLQKLISPRDDGPHSRT